MPTKVTTNHYELPSQWWNILNQTNELLFQRNGQPVAILMTFDKFMTLKSQLVQEEPATKELDEKAKLDEQMRAAALALLDDYTNDPELTIFTTALANEEFYDYDEYDE